MNYAARCMTGKNAAGFQLWCYLAMNQDQYTLALSNQALNKAFGMSKKFYDNAVHILIEKGFLSVRQGQEYDFYEIPKGNEEHQTSASGTSESPISGQLKVPEGHNQKSHLGTFKSTQTGQEILQGYDSYMTMDNSTSAQSDEQSHRSTPDDTYHPSSEEEEIILHMRKTGFLNLPTQRKYWLTIRQLLNNGVTVEKIKKAVTDIIIRASDQERAPIEDSLSYLANTIAYARS